MFDSDETIAVKDGMWRDTANGPLLIGSRCGNCGELLFPEKKNNFCPNCYESALTEVELSKEGVIKAFTIINERPTGEFYKGKVPYCYGVVTLPEGINILALFQDAEWENMKIGQNAKLIIEPLYEEEGTSVLTYKFSPIFDGELERGGKTIE
ncbi:MULTISPECIES: Zn-ribbon domain-containing OB-fold protein [Sporosarcina]|uniref:Zn-ribbon domain-containing OB-fold protein n=1 Tax=Sporosarcina TaxID=1569 RepID=UPI000A156F21|nr:MULTISPECIES: OB-fold domain-containing protein [Sporosarcina]ARJ39583.1 hypothetical protein SporoP8_12285 [Sporosarcina ureae]PIC68000.1 hypothetical protein CSV78_04200 [Sporosarcina sp. P16a]PIC83097.1 hypothetical protein CSV73_08925 [Sporosarcina sp. P1]PIC90917.1 hypothetical protein CSV71_02350 [Sporosarcina sp. P21c]PIC94309.1 hypothetical protein CSV70_00840 [Sporosarcina sp. P25]